MEELNRCRRCGSYMLLRDYNSSAIKYNCLQCGATYEKNQTPNNQTISYVDELIKLNHKLLKYEAIEQEIGIPLEVLFKALKDGIYRFYEEFEDMPPSIYYLDPIIMYDEYRECWIFYDDSKCQVYCLKDYGKTWWLENQEVNENE